MSKSTLPRHFTRALLAGFATMASLACHAQTTIIATYDFIGTTGDEAFLSPTYVAPQYGFYDVARMTGLQTGPALANTFNSTVDYGQGEEWRYLTWYGTSLGGSSLPAWDFNFVKVGYDISTGSGTLPTKAVLAYSLDSATTFDVLGSLDLRATPGAGNLNFTFPTVTVPVDNWFGATFMIRIEGGSGTDTTFAMNNGSFGGLQIGFETVPEPSTGALLILGLGVICRARRRNLEN